MRSPLIACLAKRVTLLPDGFAETPVLELTCLAPPGRCPIKTRFDCRSPYSTLDIEPAALTTITIYT